MKDARIIKTILATAACLSFTLNLHGWKTYKRIYVHTEASQEYLDQKPSDKPESYYFFQGLHFKGYINDKSLQDTEFIDIARGLAPHLAKQDYWPAQSKETCHLLLVVNWGTTSTRYRDVSLDIFPDFYDGSYYDELVDRAYSDEHMYWYGEHRASKLVGFYPYLRWWHVGYMPYEEYELRSALQTPRYFIIVTAFDFQALIHDKQWKRLWSTRFSMRSPGTNFRKAHLALSKAGGDYFGKDLDELGKENADFDPVVAEVEIGEIEVLETIDVPRGRGMLNSIRTREGRR